MIGKLTTSIIIPTIGRNSLYECLFSLGRQEEKPEEIIIVDNNPEFRAKELIKQFVESLPLVYTTEKKRGASFARNKGIAKARGEVLVFLDDDCVVLPGWLKAVKKGFADQKVKVLQGKTIEDPINIFGRVVVDLVKARAPRIKKLKKTPKGFEAKFINSNNLAIRKKTIRKNQLFFDGENFPIYHEDFDLAMRLKRNSIKISYNSEMKVRHKQNLNFFILLKNQFIKGKRQFILQKKWQQVFKTNKKAKKIFKGNKKAEVFLKKTTNRQSAVVFLFEKIKTGSLPKNNPIGYLFLFILTILFYNFGYYWEIFKKKLTGKKKKSDFDIKVLKQAEKFYFENPRLWEKIKKKNYDKEVNFLDKIFKKNSKISSVLDLGCGTGHHCDKLRRLGYFTCGIDINSKMIKFAKKNFPDCCFKKGDMKNINLNKKFDAAICLTATFSYNLTNKDVEQFLETVNKHLEKKGLLVLDNFNAFSLLLKKSFGEKKEEFFDFKEGGIETTIKRTLEEKNQLMYEERIWKLDKKKLIKDITKFRLFFPQEISYFLNKNGFRVLETYGDFDLLEKENLNTVQLITLAQKII